MKREPEFFCPEHRIYISPSTFEYESDQDNILWDHDLLNDHLKDKRESRIARDNSEDAKTWNVFRFLENSDILADYLTSIVDSPQSNPTTFFWSYSKEEKTGWSLLNEARIEFGETVRHGSEPDLMVLTDQTLFFIEAKLTATNNTAPIRKDPKYRKKYDTGADAWFSRVFKPSVEFWNLALEQKKFELLRFWLLGTWMANKLGRSFCLLNLVREMAEKEIKNIFGDNLAQDESRRFRRATWEDIYRFMGKIYVDSQVLRQYMENKTIGYRGGKLVRAFSVQQGHT
ncbi:hypothetical protein ACFLQU_05060 [Verrucomicrobiota bacterium]